MKILETNRDTPCGSNVDRPTACSNPDCPHQMSRPGRPSAWCVVAGLACSILAVAALLLLVRAADCWIEHRSQRFADHMLWMEPLDR